MEIFRTFSRQKGADSDTVICQNCQNCLRFFNRRG